MKTQFANQYPANQFQFSSIQFDDRYYNAQLKYSLRHLAFMGNVSKETTLEALEKALQICCLAGVNTNQHFKKVYMFDEYAGTMHIDCLMSKNGFNLMLMQISEINEKLAIWLWKLSEK
ncbi:MAG: hypothetical protein ACOVO1_07425 [Chitinophagaceae bacterium]